MECTCIRQTDLPHTSRLFADLIYHPERVADFYPFTPSDPDSYLQAARAIEFPADRRAGLLRALGHYNGPSPSLERLARPGTVAVVTGQQVGLFSGPAYTIYKALTAVKLARELTARGVEAVPVFWIATEDHDFAEVNQAWLFDVDHRPVRVETESAPGPFQPVGEVALAGIPLDRVHEILNGFPFAGEVEALLRKSYAPERTFGQAFASFLQSLLAEYGMLLIDPMDSAIRELAAPVMRDTLAAAPAITRRLLERNGELVQRGYHAQVHVEERTALFFLLENGRRVGMRRENGDYVSQGHRYSTEALRERAGQLSPTALLRPVIQDFMLPTVAYVGGPAELAYLAQSQVIYDEVLGRQPVALHRSGFTVVDQRSRKLMQRSGLCLQDFFHGEEPLRQKVAERLVPPGLNALMRDTTAKTVQSLEHLAGRLTAFDPTLANAVGTSRRKIEYQLSKLERKVAHEALARDARASGDAADLYGLIFPQKHLQERLYSIVPLIAKHGLGLIPQLYENVRLDCPDHQLLVA